MAISTRRRMPPKPRRQPVIPAQKVILQFPRPLLARADAVADVLQTNRSTFVRVAVEEKIQRFDRARLDEELREGYLEAEQWRTREYRDLDELACDALREESVSV